MPDETSAEEAIDFSGTERAFLCEPLAEEACRKAGVLLEELRPRSFASFSVKGQDEWLQQKRSDAYEQRRQFKWRLVREQHARLEAEDAKRRTQQAIEASAGGAAGGASVAQRQHEAALKIVVERQTRLLENELRAEAQRQRIERKQEAAAQARAESAFERTRAIEAAKSSRELMYEVRGARRELEDRLGQPTPRPARPASAPHARPSSGGGGGGSGSARSATGEAVRQREEAQRKQQRAMVEAKMAAKEASTARRREAVATEREVRRLYAEQMRLRHEERKAACELQVVQSKMRPP